MYNKTFILYQCIDINVIGLSASLGLGSAFGIYGFNSFL